MDLKKSSVDWKALAKKVLHEEDRYKDMALKEWAEYNKDRGDKFSGFESIAIEDAKGPRVVVEGRGSFDERVEDYYIGFEFEGDQCVGVSVVH